MILVIHGHEYMSVPPHEPLRRFENRSSMPNRSPIDGPFSSDELTIPALGPPDSLERWARRASLTVVLFPIAAVTLVFLDETFPGARRPTRPLPRSAIDFTRFFVECGTFIIVAIGMTNIAGALAVRRRRKQGTLAFVAWTGFQGCMQVMLIAWIYGFGRHQHLTHIEQTMLAIHTGLLGVVTGLNKVVADRFPSPFEMEVGAFPVIVNGSTAASVAKPHSERQPEE